MLGGQGRPSVFNLAGCGLERGARRGGVNDRQWTCAGTREEAVWCFL
jgi:hypothetical protein